MIRTILVVLYLVIFFVISLPLFLVEAIFGKKHKAAMQHMAYKVVSWGFRSISWLSGTSLTVIGRENVPAEGAVLYVAKHRSYFDIVSIYPYLKDPSAFIAKKELEKIPLLRRWMRILDCEFLDREDVRAAMKSILGSIESVKAGMSMVIFPEGTRTPGDEMLEFKEGSFKIAERAGCPVIPVAISNTENIFESHMPSIRKTRVTIEFGRPVDMLAMDRSERRHTGRIVQEQIAEMLKKNHIDA